MKTSLRRGALLALALALTAGPLLATAVDARNSRYREPPRQGAPDHRGRHQGPPRDRQHWTPPPRDRQHWSPPRRDHHRAPGHRHHRDRRHHHRGSGVVPFLGGLAIGAIIGNNSPNYCPPPPPPVIRQFYVYDCGWCAGRYLDYDAWLEHLIVVHGVPAYDIDGRYPPFTCGHWEAY